MSARRVIRGAVPNGGVRRVRGAMRPAVFDPNARDADGDGRVQDSTQFERPISPSSSLGRNSSRRRVRRGSAETERFNNWSSTDFSNSEKPIDWQELQRRYPLLDDLRDGNSDRVNNNLGPEPMRSQATVGNTPKPTPSRKPQNDDIDWDDPLFFNDGMGTDMYTWEAKDKDSRAFYQLEVQKNGVLNYTYYLRARDKNGKEIFNEVIKNEPGKMPVVLSVDELKKRLMKIHNSSQESKKPTTRNQTPPPGPEPMRSQATTGKPSKPSKSNAQRTLDQINKNASSEKFDAGRDYGDYETKFPKHEVDGMMGKDSADLTKMREMMKGLIKEAKASGVQYDPISRMSDADLQELWSTLNAMKEPETRAQFLAMMLADFELGMRKLGRDRAKSGPASFEDPAKVEKILDNLRGRNLI